MNASSSDGVDGGVSRELDEPDQPSDIWYVCPPDEVPSHRLLMQGDVLVLESGPVCVVTHACSMRQGVQLHPTQIVAPVRARENALWRGGYDWMPLPELAVGEYGPTSVNLRELSSVSTDELKSAKRIAAMSEIGIQLLQQRMAHHLTRVVIELEVIAELSAPILMEANLHEEWVESLGEEAEAEFHALLDADDRRLRIWMQAPRTRYQAQSEIRRAMVDRQGN